MSSPKSSGTLLRRLPLKSTMEENILVKTSSSRCNLHWFNRAHGRACQKKQRLYNAAKTSDKDKDKNSGRNIEQLKKNETGTNEGKK